MGTLINGILSGIMTGGAYSLMGVSITLMYRSTGVLSFAHAAFAMVAAYVYSDLTIGRGVSPRLAAVVALLVTLVFGLVVERLAIRPVAKASPTARLITTVAVLGATTALMLLKYGVLPQRAPVLFPEGGFRLGDVFITYQQFGSLLIGAFGAAALAAFLKRAKLGIAVRATADNADAARLMGIPSRRISQFNWAVGSVTAGAAGILIAPSTIVSVATFPLLELRALVAALFGGLSGLVLTFVGGLAVGVVESLAAIKFSAAGVRDLAILILVVVLLLVRRQWEVGGGTTALGLGGGRVRSLPPGLRRVTRAVAAAAAVTVGLLALLQPAGSNYWAFVWAIAVFYALEGLSLVLLSGWGGQVTLMQAAYVGFGAYGVLYLVNQRGWAPEPAALVAVVVAVAAGAIVGYPALRVTGPQFAIVSLAFGGWAASYLFTRPELQGTLPRDRLFGFDVTSDTTLYYIMLAATVVLYLLVWNLRRSRFGGLLIASRDAAGTVAQFGGNPERIRLSAFLLASAIGGVGGAFYGLLVTGFRSADFGPQLAISLLLFTVVGGSTSLAGPLVAGVLFAVIPNVIQQQSTTGSEAQITQLVAALVVVAMVALRPQGLASLWARPARGADGTRPRAAPGRFGAVHAAHSARRAAAATPVPGDNVWPQNGGHRPAGAPANGRDDRRVEIDVR
jgi:sulfate-transporting ATPase